MFEAFMKKYTANENRLENMLKMMKSDISDVKSQMSSMKANMRTQQNKIVVAQKKSSDSLMRKFQRIQKQKKPVSHHQTIKLPKRNIVHRPLLKKHNKKYIEKMIAKEPMPYFRKKTRKGVQVQHQKQVEKPKKNNQIDMDLLSKFLAQRKQESGKKEKQNKSKDELMKLLNAQNSRNDPKKIVEEISSSDEDLKLPPKENIFKVNKKSINLEQEKFQHDKHKKLNDEASKLFEALKLLKSRQKGILSDLDLTKLGQASNTNSHTNVSQKPSETKIIANPPSKNTQTKTESENQNASSNDATLSEIEKQINLLNSFRTNPNNMK